jgi:hypothetical protein
MPRWTVSNGDDGDIFTIERDSDGHVVIDIPSHKQLRVDRRFVEDLRRKLGAAIADEGDPASDRAPRQAPSS